MTFKCLGCGVFCAAFLAVRLSAFDLQLEGGGDSRLLAWPSTELHEFQVMSGSSVTDINTTLGRILTPTGTSVKIPVTFQRTQEFFKVYDNGWAFKIIGMSNNASGEVFIQWTSEAGKEYRVQCLTNLWGASRLIALGRPATPPINKYKDTVNSGDGPFYYWIEYETNGVYVKTKNVGCIYKPTSVQGLNFIQYGLETFDGFRHYTPMEIFGTMIPTGSICHMSDGGTGWVEEVVTGDFQPTGWSPNTNELWRGKGFFLRIKTTASVVRFSGEVPDANSAPTTAINLSTNWNYLGYPYPVEIRWTNTVLAKNAAYGDRMYVWSHNDQMYKEEVYVGDPLCYWHPGTSVIHIGMGFYFKPKNVTSNPSPWIEPKPYTWP